MNKPYVNYNKKFFWARYLEEVPGGVSINEAQDAR